LLQWEVLGKDKHGIITQKLLASFSMFRALCKATHKAIAGVSWGCTEESLTTNPTLSYSRSLATLLDTEVMLLQIFLGGHHGHPLR